MLTKPFLFSGGRFTMLVLGIFLFAVSTSAATYIVTNPDHSSFPTPPGSLRHAIEQAQANPGPDTIFFDLTGPCPCEVTVGHPDFNISTEVTIDGGNQVSLRAQSLLTLFIVQSSGNLVLRNLDMFANVSPSETAIRNAGTVAIENSTIRRFFGSGIRNTGQMVVVGSAVTGNTTRDFPVSPDGGGIRNTGTLTVINSTISGNEAIGHGGGIYNTGTLTVRNSTIAANRSNVPDGGGTSAFEDGGGIYSGGTETLQNTIVIGNTLSLGIGEPDVSDDINSGAIDSYSNVLVGNPGTAGQMIHGTNGSIIGSSNGTQLLPMSEVIAGLGSNGGPTNTHKLVAGSLALNAGSNALSVGADGTTPLATDQRGTGFSRVVGSSVDIGSCECEPNVAPALSDLAINAVTEGSAATLTGTIADGNSADTHSLTIDWGDGSAPQEVNGLSAGSFQVTHTYADDSPSGTSSDSYSIDVSVSDGTLSDDDSVSVTVNNAAPSAVDLAMNPSPLEINTQGTLTFNKSDAGVNDTLTDIEVDWGDGVVQHPVANPSSTSFAFTHTYAAAGSFTVNVKLVDDDNGSSTRTLNVSVVLPAPPAAPTLLRVDSVSRDRMTVVWIDNSNNEGGFAIEACQNNGCTRFREIGRVAANVTTYTDVNLIANTQYFYRVRAFNLGGFSAYSNKASGKTLRK